MKWLIVIVTSLAVGVALTLCCANPTDSEKEKPVQPYHYDARSVEYGMQFYQSVDAAFQAAKTDQEKAAIMRGFQRWKDSLRTEAIADSIKTIMGQ